MAAAAVPRPADAVSQPPKEQVGEDLRLCRALCLLRVSLSHLLPVLHEPPVTLVRALAAQLGADVRVPELLCHLLTLALRSARVCSHGMVAELLDAADQFSLVAPAHGLTGEACRLKHPHGLGLGSLVDATELVLAHGKVLHHLLVHLLTVELHGVPQGQAKLVLHGRSPGGADGGHRTVVDRLAILCRESRQQCPRHVCTVDPFGMQ
mmetsp:Transcript_143137/g.398853  ORF Transcript_143137/g.398853 Transcript_143137/m.398853 type:complete len:208 (-) Transcript_143137:834-1457(-)